MRSDDSLYTAPGVPIEGARAPDKVLVIGATGQIGRVFLEQGLATFDRTEFRALVRDPGQAKDFPSGVDCRLGDVRELESIRTACEGFTSDSLIFDSVTRIVLTKRDEDGAIADVNLQGVVNVIEVARELGLTLHKAHSSAGLPCPRTGTITERTDVDVTEEEAVYAELPYLRAKRDATQALRRAKARGLRVMVSYLPSPVGPASRADALLNSLLERSVRTGTYVYPRGIDLAYVDARDAAKAHWVGFTHEVYDDFILSNNVSPEQLVSAVDKTLGTSLGTRALGSRTVVTLGRILDFLKKWVFKKTEFPLSEATAFLMFANMAYSSDKARDRLAFEPRPAEQSFADHIRDLATRGLIASRAELSPVSIW